MPQATSLGEGLRAIASQYLDTVAELTSPPSPRESGKGLRPPKQYADNHPAPRLVGKAVTAANSTTALIHASNVQEKSLSDLIERLGSPDQRRGRALQKKA